MTDHLMHLKILMPFQIFAEISQVKRIIAETSEGSFGNYPRRLDCVTALEPGILTYETADSGNEIYIAVDEGILVKQKQSVLVSVRNAIGGAELGELHDKVRSEFLELDDHERSVRIDTCQAGKWIRSTVCRLKK